MRRRDGGGGCQEKRKGLREGSDAELKEEGRIEEDEKEEKEEEEEEEERNEKEEKEEEEEEESPIRED